MAETGLSEVLAYLRKTCAVKAARDLSDAELMERFVADREEAAFSVLVRRRRSHAKDKAHVARSALFPRVLFSSVKLDLSSAGRR